ncbi:MAG: transposase [Bacteroidetes bacterium]|nr:transposase [Bacteroidota bacterium]NDC37142.1 transposase [Pseudomonadota bacterium]
MGKRGRRRRFSASEKVAILKRHLVEKEAVAHICEELKIHPNQFYEWQKLFFENGVKAFESDEQREEAKLRDRVATLEAKLQRKDSVLAELMEDHVALKKSLGEA